MSFPVQNLIVQKRTAKRKAGPLDAPVALYNPDGTPFKAGGDAPTADTLSGVSTVGRAVMKARDAAAARTAIGAGAPYTLPAAGTTIGGVKKGATVAANAAVDPPAAAAAPTKAEYDALLAYAKSVKATLNALITSLKASGAIG